jgi:HAD superfamily phosphatase (TIGR01668 family)
VSPVKFIPDFRFDKFDDVTVEFLEKLGIKGIILDIDNTLEPYENAVPGKRVLDWFSMLEKHGIRFSVVSNNNEERVKTFLSGFDVPAYSKAKKPCSKKLSLAMKEMGTDTGNTVFIGDQIFTDVWAAHNAKIKAVLLPPINDKRDLITRFKRLLEKPFLRKYEKIKERERKQKNL